MVADRVVKVTLRAMVAEYSRGMQEAARQTREVGSEAQKLAQRKQAIQSLGGAAVVVGTAMSALTYAVAKTGIEYNTLQQKSRAALTTLLGSAQAANEQMDKLDAFARTSPFSKAVFIQAQQQMLAFGIEAKKVVPYLDAIQNAVAAAGGSNADIAGLVATMSKIQSSAKLTAQDLMEFGNRGVDAAGLIGASMGKTGAQIRAEITAGTLDAGVALDALVDGMNTRFAGAADNVKNTFEGAMDRVQAAWRDLSADLTKPLVDPNGGGALVDLLNWAADAMRAFQALPDPIKQTGGALFALAGFASLAGGTALLMIPKIVQFKANLEALKMSAGEATGKLGTFAKVAGGALAGIAIGITALEGLKWALDQIGPSAEEMQNKIATAKSGVDLFAAAVSKSDPFGDAARHARLAASDFEHLGDTLTAIAEGTQQDMGAMGAAVYMNLQRVGGELADLARTNLPAAQRQFRALAEDAGLSDAQLRTMLEVMDPFRKALIDQASSVNIAADSHEFLEFALGESERATKDNEAAMSALRGQAEDTEGSIESLADALRGFGSVTLDAREANRRFEEALADATEALKENGKTLDTTTDAGRKNEAALDAIAAAANTAAAATLEHTGSEDLATQALERGRDELVRKARQFGMTKAEAEAYADSVIADMREVKAAIDKVPSSKSVQINETGNALGRLRELNNLFAKSQGWSTNVSVGTGTVLRPGSHQGNLFEGMQPQHFAQGGMRSGIYAGVPGGIFAEAEKGVPWEAFISGRAQDRARNIGIWMETGRRLGLGSSPQIDYSALAAAVASAMPEHMNVSGVVELGDRTTRTMTRDTAAILRADSRKGVTALG